VEIKLRSHVVNDIRCLIVSVLGCAWEVSLMKNYFNLVQKFLVTSYSTCSLGLGTSSFRSRMGVQGLSVVVERLLFVVSIDIRNLEICAHRKKIERSQLNPS
jgi:hypothetical protein